MQIRVLRYLGYVYLFTPLECLRGDLLLLGFLVAVVL